MSKNLGLCARFPGMPCFSRSYLIGSPWEVHRLTASVTRGPCLMGQRKCEAEATPS